MAAKVHCITQYMIAWLLAKCHRAALRRSFTLCGTTEYMAPEMVRGTGYGFAADW